MESKQFFDVDTGYMYTLHLSKADARRSESDLKFAQQLLQYAKGDNVNDEPKEVNQDENNPGTNQSNDNFDEKSIWAYNETLALISAYENHKENLRNAKERKFVWKDISNELLSNGFEKNAKKCENKWRNLIRTYKNIKDLSKSTGRGATKFQFFDMIDEILRDKPAINCAHTYSSTKATIDSTTVSESESSEISSAESFSKEKDTKNRKRASGAEMLKKKSQELLDIKIKYLKRKCEEKENKDKKGKKN